MQKLVTELKQIMSFKDQTDIGDLILIVSKEPQMLAYGLVTDIERDSTRKDEWWHLSFTFLTVPPQQATWTMRTAQMTGMEVFTMGGEERFVKGVAFGPDIAPSSVTEPSTTKKKNKAKTGAPFLKRVK
jgi:hypothetical protein